LHFSQVTLISACVEKNDSSNKEPSLESENAISNEDAPSEAVPQLSNSAEAVKSEPAEESHVEAPSSESIQAQEEAEEEASAQPSGPLGSWTRVKKVDSGPVFSPLTARYRAEEERERKTTEAREKKAEKLDPLVFTEKTSAVLTKKVKGPIEFKKRTAAKSVRQRIQ
ncbi:hypothetical protein TELCIR_08987, partial [Teladorsagia circumcincta]